MLARLVIWLWGAVPDIFVNLIAELIFLSGIILVGVLIHRHSKGRRLEKFFGLSPGKVLYICLSDPKLHGNRVVLDGVDRDRFGIGHWLQLSEFRAVQSLADKFRVLLPGSDQLPQGFTRLFFADHPVEIIPAKADVRWRAGVPFLTVGSAAFNVASEVFEEKTNKTVRYVIEGNPGAPDLVKLITPFREFVRKGAGESSNEMLAIVAKATIDQYTAFYCAGFNEVGSSGAVYFLANNWNSLAEHYGVRDFVIVLDFWGVADVCHGEPVIRHKGEWNWRGY